MRPAHEDLVVFPQTHLDPGHGAPDAAGPAPSPGLVHRADGRGFREAVHLEHGDAEHLEESLRLFAERRGAADERPEIRADLAAHAAEEHGFGEGEPQAVASPGTPFLLSEPGGTGAPVEAGSSARLQLLLDAGADALEQERHVLEIVRRGEAQLLRQLLDVRGQRQQAAARQAGEEQDPRTSEAEGQVVEDAFLAGVTLHQLVESLQRARQHVIEVAGGENDPLRVSRGAGGIDDGEGVLRLLRQRRRVGGDRGGQGSAVRNRAPGVHGNAAPVGAAGGCGCSRGGLGADLAQEAEASLGPALLHGGAKQVVAADDQGGAAIAHHRHQLLRRLPRVEGHAHQTLRHDRQVRRRPADAVGAEEDAAVARAHTGAAQEAAGAGDAGEQLAGSGAFDAVGPSLLQHQARGLPLQTVEDALEEVHAQSLRRTR